jgi:hypothetical protein
VIESCVVAGMRDMFKLSSFNSASMIFLSLIGDNDPRFAPTYLVIDDHYYLPARGMLKQDGSIPDPFQRI